MSYSVSRKVVNGDNVFVLFRDDFGLSRVGKAKNSAYAKFLLKNFVSKVLEYLDLVVFGSLALGIVVVSLVSGEMLFAGLAIVIGFIFVWAFFSRVLDDLPFFAIYADDKLKLGEDLSSASLNYDWHPNEALSLSKENFVSFVKFHCKKNELENLRQEIQKKMSYLNSTSEVYQFAEIKEEELWRRTHKLNNEIDKLKNKTNRTKNSNDEEELLELVMTAEQRLAS